MGLSGKALQHELVWRALNSFHRDHGPIKKFVSIFFKGGKK